jgi:hypothetical protein
VKYYLVPLMFMVVVSIFSAGCTQSSGSVPVTPVVSVPTLPAPAPVTSFPAAAATSVPRQVVTIIRQVSLPKDIKDSDLLFTLQVPVEWNVKTHRLNNADDSEGLLYETDLVWDNIFIIYTYTASRSQDQAYRDHFRKWSPVPAETTVTINEITYDRFESTAGNRTRVAYVARKSSANERGYASVLVFTADTGDRFQKDDFEKIVSSFRYFSGSSAGSVPGEEIPRISASEASSAGTNSPA